MVIAPESSPASRRNADTADRSAPAARRCTSAMKSRMGVSRTRPSRALIADVAVPTTEFTYATARSCSQRSESMNVRSARAGSGRRTRPRRRVTIQSPGARRWRPSVTAATLRAQWPPCASSTGPAGPPMMLSASSRWLWPSRITSMPGTSRATRAAACSGGSPVAMVS